MTIYGSKALRLSVYKVCKARHLEHQAQYVQYCADMAKEGYAPQYCIHGTNQWTDYDNICGGCESDYTLNDYIMGTYRTAMEQYGNIMRYYHRIVLDPMATIQLRDAANAMFDEELMVWRARWGITPTVKEY